MSYQPRIVAFAGSTREHSFNKRLVAIAAKGAEETGADVTLIDLRDYPMPLFDEDLEAKEGKNKHAHAFKKLLVNCDGILISSPEYNGSLSAVLKNSIDWATRADEGDVPGSLPAFRGKVVSLMSASPGGPGRPERPGSLTGHSGRSGMHHATRANSRPQCASSIRRRRQSDK